jgi:hypothetical protein
MKRLFIIFLFFGIGKSAQLQTFVERIYLKDSSFMEGYIIEQVPTQYFLFDRIKFKDTILVAFNKIWKITKIYKPAETVEKKVASVINEQKLTYAKVAFFELLGNSGLYSLNFDMRTQKGINNKWGFRVGYSRLALNGKDTLTGENLNINAATFPFALNYLFGKKNKFLELGLGATYVYLKANGKVLDNADLEVIDFDIFNVRLESMVGTFNIGYRYMPNKNGLTFGALSTIFVYGGKAYPFIGFNIGYKFK